MNSQADSHMNQQQLLEIYDQEQRREVNYPGVERQVLPQLIRHVDPNGVMSQVLYTDLDEHNADTVIAEQIAFFAGQDFEWKYFTHDSPTDLKQRLAAYGFEVGEAEAILMLDLETAPESLFAPVTQDLRQITEPELLAGIMTVQSRVFGNKDTVDENEDNWVARQLAEELATTPDQVSVYAAYADDDVVVSSAWVRFPENNRFASLWGAATLRNYRKRGFYTALLAIRAQEARQRGRRFLTVDASPMSQPILARFGFQWITTSHPCMWKGRPA